MLVLLPVFGLISVVFISFVVILVVPLILIDYVICVNQRRCAYLFVVIFIAMVIPKTFVGSVLSRIAEVISGVSSSMRLAFDFTEMVRKTIDSAILVF